MIPNMLLDDNVLPLIEQLIYKISCLDMRNSVLFNSHSDRDNLHITFHLECISLCDLYDS